MTIHDNRKCTDNSGEINGFPSKHPWVTWRKKAPVECCRRAPSDFPFIFVMKVGWEKRISRRRRKRKVINTFFSPWFRAHFSLMLISTRKGKARKRWSEEKNEDGFGRQINYRLDHFSGLRVSGNGISFNANLKFRRLNFNAARLSWKSQYLKDLRDFKSKKRERDGRRCRNWLFLRNDAAGKCVLERRKFQCLWKLYINKRFFLKRFGKWRSMFHIPFCSTFF